MQERKRPEAVAFDVNETLFSLDALADELVRCGLPRHALELIFAEVLRDGFGAAAAGAFLPMSSLFAARVRAAGATDAQVEDIMSAFKHLEAHPEARSALERAQEGNLRVATLTNGSAALTDHLLRRAGLRHLVDRALDVEPAGLWKPRPEPYLWAARELEVDPVRLALVATHPWDVLGARRAGLTAGWPRRGRPGYPLALEPPHVEGEALSDVIGALLQLAP